MYVDHHTASWLLDSETLEVESQSQQKWNRSPVERKIPWFQNQQRWQHKTSKSEFGETERSSKKLLEQSE